MEKFAHNFGPVSTMWLKEIGIHSLDDLRSVGIEEAFRLLVRRGLNVNALILYAMEGALTHTHWNAIPTERKAELRSLASQIKKSLNHK